MKASYITFTWPNPSFEDLLKSKPSGTIKILHLSVVSGNFEAFRAAISKQLLAKKLQEVRGLGEESGRIQLGNFEKLSCVT